MCARLPLMVAIRAMCVNSHAVPCEAAYLQ